MIARKEKRNLLDVIQTNRSLAAQGIRAEAVGRQSIRVSRAGRFVGLWREAIGSIEWYPAGSTSPTHRSATVEDAARFVATNIAHAA